MEFTLTTSNIMFAIGLVGALITAINYFKKPQEDIELKQAIITKEIDNKATVLAQKEMESKASLLDQQARIERESNEKKFADIGVMVEKAFALAQNHIHTLDTKQDVMTNSLNALTVQVEKLSTIIDERLPKTNL